MNKRDYSGCTHPDCDKCKCKDCIIDHTKDFKELEEFRKEHNIQKTSKK